MAQPVLVAGNTPTDQTGFLAAKNSSNFEK
jgi:hypothetical protein